MRRRRLDSSFRKIHGDGKREQFKCRRENCLLLLGKERLEDICRVWRKSRRKGRDGCRKRGE